MKSIGLPDELHEQLKMISKATGILQYRLIQEALVFLKEKYKDQIKNVETSNEQVV